MASWQLGSFRPNNAGIIEVWKSQGMRDALAEAASELCARANDQGSVHGDAPDDLYKDGVDLAGFTAIGYVRTNGLEGRIDQQYHRTLDNINH